MYIVPNQNAAFYLAHEFGHQLGLDHQSKGPVLHRFLHVSDDGSSHRFFRTSAVDDV